MTYAKKYPAGYFEGKVYVFDGRVSVSYYDEQYVVCDSCIELYNYYCTQKCCETSFGNRLGSASSSV